MSKILTLIKNTVTDHLIEVSTNIHTHEEYLKVKQNDKDYHGISDAANDLRELEAKKEVFVSLLKYFNYLDGNQALDSKWDEIKSELIQEDSKPDV